MENGGDNNNNAKHVIIALYLRIGSDQCLLEYGSIEGYLPPSTRSYFVPEYEYFVYSVQ